MNTCQSWRRGCWRVLERIRLLIGMTGNRNLNCIEFVNWDSVLLLDGLWTSVPSPCKDNDTRNRLRTWFGILTGVRGRVWISAEV
jgi:hypothetical protein